MGEVQGAFAQIVKSTGGRYDEDRERRLLALKIDNIPVADIYADQRKPDSNFYGQGFVEGLSVARVLVPMDLDVTVENIVRRDAPDLRVDFSDRPPVFIEHSTVTPYDGLTFDRHLDDLNIAVRKLVDKTSWHGPSTTPDTSLCASPIQGSVSVPNRR